MAKSIKILAMKTLSDIRDPGVMEALKISISQGSDEEKRTGAFI